MEGKPAEPGRQWKNSYGRGERAEKTGLTGNSSMVMQPWKYMPGWKTDEGH